MRDSVSETRIELRRRIEPSHLFVRFALVLPALIAAAACGARSELWLHVEDAGLESDVSEASPPFDAPFVDATAPDVMSDAGPDVDAPDADAVDAWVLSCAPGGPGLTNCGPDPGESCCTNIEVPGGQFHRNYDGVDLFGYPPYLAADGGPTQEKDPATLSTFRLDKYLVTVGRFRQFVAAWNAGYVPPAGSGKHAHLHGGLGLVNGNSDAGVAFETGWDSTNDKYIQPTDAQLMCVPSHVYTWTPDAGKNENLPINCVSWYEAYAFCIWDGGFLPSDAETQYAGAGGSEERLYPWGSTAPGTKNHYAIYGCNESGGNCTLTPADFAPVGSAPAGAGRWGHLDLAGEVMEFTLDFISPVTIPCVDCANLTFVGYWRVARGGNYISSAIWLAVPMIYDAFGGADRNPGNGFRCARSP